MKVQDEDREQLWEKYSAPDNRFPVDVVAIETVGNCNRVCGYCPVSAHPKRKGRLSTEVVKNVLDQLSDLQYQEKLTFHFYNEPLLDKRIIEFLTYAARVVPNTRRLLTTNGDLLDFDTIVNLLEDDITNIAVSGHDIETFERFSAMKERLDPAIRSHLEIRSYYRVGDGTRATWVTNRGGAIDVSAYNSDEVIEAGIDGCNRVEFKIDYNGKVHTWCMEFIGGFLTGKGKETPVI